MLEAWYDDERVVFVQVATMCINFPSMECPLPEAFLSLAAVPYRKHILSYSFRCQYLVGARQAILASAYNTSWRGLGYVAWSIPPSATRYKRPSLIIHRTCTTSTKCWPLPTAPFVSRSGPDWTPPSDNCKIGFPILPRKKPSASLLPTMRLSPYFLLQFNGLLLPIADEVSIQCIRLRFHRRGLTLVPCAGYHAAVFIRGLGRFSTLHESKGSQDSCTSSESENRRALNDLGALIPSSAGYSTGSVLILCGA